MLAGRAESGPRAGRGSGRWSLQVPSKCFESTATERRNPSKRTERSRIRNLSNFLSKLSNFLSKLSNFLSKFELKLIPVPNGSEVRFKLSE